MIINSYVRFEMPVDVAMQEPRARVVGGKAESDIVASPAHTHNITAHWVRVVVGGASRDAYNVKCVTVEVERMLWRKI